MGGGGTGKENEQESIRTVKLVDLTNGEKRKFSKTHNTGRVKPGSGNGREAKETVVVPRRGGWLVMRDRREVTRDRQEKLRPGSQGVGDASGFDSRPAPGERRRGKEGRGRQSGGAQTIGAASYGEGRGPETDTSAGASRSARRGTRRAPSPAAAAVSYRLGLLFFAQVSGCPGPSRGANRTASPGIRHRPPPRQR